MSTKICEYCGNSYEPKKSPGFSRQRFCGKECQRAWWKENKDKGNPKGFTYVCQNCGKEYWTAYSDRNTCCSRECGWEFASKRALIDKECLSCGQKFKGLTNDKYCSDECKERGVKRNCEACGAEFYGHSVVCSDECRNQKRRQENRERFRTYKRSIGRNSGRIEKIICRHCGKEFEQAVHNQVKLYCSKKCNRKANEEANPEKYALIKAIERHRRRARQYHNGSVENINPIKVFERDGWRCGICGEKVNPRLKHPHPMSASLDHIIALANGGTHTLNNVQLAYLRCNGKKSNVGPGQLRLDFIER